LRTAHFAHHFEIQFHRGTRRRGDRRIRFLDLRERARRDVSKVVSLDRPQSSELWIAIVRTIASGCDSS
jgi:hypothetical protein